MAEKETWMILHVDLQCPSCYKKIKKILCKFPQIRDQVYDKPKNVVKIRVVCRSPEKIRDKLCCKGGKVIKSIEIVEPSKPKDPEKPKSASYKLEASPKPEEPPEETTAEPDSETIKTSDDKSQTKEPPRPMAPRPPEPPFPVFPPPQPPVVVAIVVPYPAPVGFCCPQCHKGLGGGPCYVGFGRPVPPPPCYDNYYYGYGYNKGWYVSRCDDYFSENT